MSVYSDMQYRHVHTECISTAFSSTILHPNVLNPKFFPSPQLRTFLLLSLHSVKTSKPAFSQFKTPRSNPALPQELGTSSKKILQLQSFRKNSLKEHQRHVDLSDRESRSNMNYVMGNEVRRGKSLVTKVLHRRKKRGSEEKVAKLNEAEWK